MADQRSTPSGSIYDLGYRHYDGVRLGRPHAVWTLFNYSLRAVFGIGRSLMSKVFPIGLAVIAFAPAVIEVGIAAISPQDFELVEPVDYFGFVSIVVALFCAVVAPEMIGRDQRYNTLPLYFSRTLSRADYVTAKTAALGVALFAVFFLPQVLLVLGNAVAADDLLDSLKDDADQFPPIFASSVLVAAFMTSMSVAIASQSPRRALATGAVLAYFVVFTTIGNILVETTSDEARRLSVLLSPGDMLEGAVRWVFGSSPEPDSAVDRADLAGSAYFFAALAYISGALAYLYRRYARLNV